MADRLLVFANSEVQKLLKENFVTVAADDWYQRRRKDKVGEYFAKVVDQSPRKGAHTKQGHYIFTATGKLLGFNNNRGPEKRLAMMKNALSKWDKLLHLGICKDQQPVSHPVVSNTAKRMPVHLPKINRLTRPSSLFSSFPKIGLPIDFKPCRLYF